MNNDIRFVPVQKICLLCPNELQYGDGTQGLTGRLCRQCIKFVREQVLREVAANPKIVRVQ